jgi:GNAT superfamily N-acetyltransferase
VTDEEMQGMRETLFNVASEVSKAMEALTAKVTQLIEAPARTDQRVTALISVSMVVTKPPSECTTDELSAFKELVEKGGEVALHGLSDLIRRAERLLFLYAGKHKIIGVGALKNPRVSHKNEVFQKSKSPDSPGEFGFEIGWIFIEEEFHRRGYSRAILENLIKLAGNANVYLTTREDNVPMRKTSERLSFKQSGSAYQSDKGDHRLVLFTRR